MHIVIVSSSIFWLLLLSVGEHCAGSHNISIFQLGIVRVCI